MEERFCANCGSRPESGSCCWYVDGETEALKPHPSIGAKAWEAWNADQRFLIALLMEQFGGAAEEWELLRRLPWTCSRLSNCTCDPWGAWAVPAGQYPCMRAREE